MAALDLGILRVTAGDTEGAREAYEIVIDAGHGDYAPKAAFNLSSLLESEGDVDGAKAAYEIAADYLQTDVYAKAKERLDRLR